jgi:hypothetical protein
VWGFTATISGGREELLNGPAGAGVELNQCVTAAADGEEPGSGDPLGQRSRVLVRRQRVVLGVNDERGHRHRLEEQEVMSRFPM